MTNKGASTIDPATDVGQVRLNVGDTTGTPLVPPETGFLNYQYMSDDEIASLLEAADGSVTRATGFAFRKIATYLTLRASNITTDDLRIETLGRAKAMRDIANDWIADADAEDERAESAIFEILPFPGRPNPYRGAEGALRPFVI